MTSPEQDLASIRALMERSAKFMSLSGRSGILAGIYALAGAVVAYSSFDGGRALYSPSPDRNLTPILGIGIVVLLATLVTALTFSLAMARRQGNVIWNTTSRNLLAAISAPLVAGGFWMIILLLQHQWALLVPSSLLFYGLALVSGSRYTFSELRFLGWLEIVIGLLAAAFPQTALLSWSLGFGVLHILYGAIMYRRYER